MELENSQNNALAKLPMLKLGEYEMWEIRIKQYFQIQEYMQVEEKICKKNDVKARSLLLMALPNEHQLTFNQYVDASIYESLDTHVVVWMKKPDFDTMGLDDLYNNFKIVEQKVKRTAAANNDDKNLAFLTTSSPSSTNTINTVNTGVGKIDFKSGSTKLVLNSNSYLRDILGDILGKDMYYPLTFVKPIRVSLVYKRNPKAQCYIVSHIVDLDLSKLSIVLQGLSDPKPRPTSGIRAFRGNSSKEINRSTNNSITTLSYKMSQPANDDFSQHLSDGEESNHEDASDTGTAPKQQQQVIPQTTAISNIKLPILKKEEYDIWAMEMEHYLEYIDNEFTAAEIQAVEKERKAKNILLMAIPKEHMRRFHGMDDAKEIWEAIRTRFGGNANSKKMQKAVFKQQFEAFKISHSEGVKRDLKAWSIWQWTMRTNPEIDNLSIDDLYNKPVFEHEISSVLQNIFNSCTPSTSSTNIPEKEVLAGFADEVIYSLFAKQTEDLDLLHEDLEQIDDVDIEEMDINWQIAMIAIRMKKFYKKTGRRVRVDGKTHVGFDKKKIECFNCHNTGHFARECTAKGTHDGKKKRDSLYQHQEAGKQEKNQMGLLTMDDGIVNWGEHTEAEETNHALMAISSSNEVSLCSKTCIDSYNKLKLLYDEQMNQLGDQEAQILSYSQAVKKLEAQLVTSQKQQLSLNEKLAFQANEIHEKDEKLKRYRRIGMGVVKEKEQLQKTVNSWKDSSKNLWKLINSGMSSTSKIGLGYE
ncbi:ribonuclease H-like domain-containing protein, partial [Tanacetum coccineum]